MDEKNSSEKYVNALRSVNDIVGRSHKILRNIIESGLPLHSLDAARTALDSLEVAHKSLYQAMDAKPSRGR